MKHKSKQSRIVKLAQAAAKRKQEQRLINRDPPDVQPPSAGIVWDGTDYLTASDNTKD
jgi:hypothetical protein